MRHRWLLFIAIAATALFVAAFIGRWFPLGVPDQWHWDRLGPWDPPVTPWIAFLPAACFAGGLVAWVLWTLGRVEQASRRFFLAAIAGVTVLGGGFQLFLEIAAPISLQKWGMLFYGAHAAARYGFSDPGNVLRDHAKAIATFEPNHVSVNPVGWVLVYRSLLTFYDSHPAATEWMWRCEPHELAWAIREIGGVGRTPLADHASITTVALTSRLLALLAAWPVAWLSAQRFGRSAAVVAASMTLLVPVASLLAPVVDTVYPTFAALIWALSYRAARTRSWWMAGLAGALIGVGMLFSLCFLVVAALAALMVAVLAAQGTRPSAASLVAAPVGWLLPLAAMALCGHWVWDTWRVNLEKNHEFNAFSGCSYAVWAGVNPLEFAIALGIPATVFLLARAGRSAGSLAGLRRADPLWAAWAAIVLLLDLAGMNRGEVCRLWYFLMPVGAAMAIEWLPFAAKQTRGVVACLLVLQAVECAVLSRELLIISPWPTHDTFETYLHKDNGKWMRLRRLQPEEFRRRAEKR